MGVMLKAHCASIMIAAKTLIIKGDSMKKLAGKKLGKAFRKVVAACLQVVTQWKNRRKACITLILEV